VPLRFLSLDSVSCVVIVASMAAIFVVDLLWRGRAGSVRFRLPLASKAGADQAGSWKMPGSWLYLTLGVLMLVLGLLGNQPWALVLGTFNVTQFVKIRWDRTRHDRSRRAGWVLAGLELAGGAGLAAWGVLTLLTQRFPPTKSTLSWPLYLIAAGAFLGVFGVYQVVEMFRGTVLRERGIELFGATRSWKGVTVGC
jgi:hypothetical protein